jgi:hypothetical protein
VSEAGTLETLCPRCGLAYKRGDSNHDYVCIETMLMALYQVGVKRGLEGEVSVGSFDDQGAELLGDILALAWSWREANQDKLALGAGIAAATPFNRPRDDHDLDTRIAAFLAWENVGWLDGLAVSGEAAWYDPRVVRRRFSMRLEDAMVVKRHPALRPYSLYQVHRIYGNRWEWHMATRTADGHMESLVREATAPMAICMAALKLASATGGRSMAG